MDADIELGCAIRQRPAGAVPIIVDGGGHELVDTCPSPPSPNTFAAVTAVELRDISILGPEVDRDGHAILRTSDAPLTVVSSTLATRNPGGKPVQVGPGSSFVDSTVGGRGPAQVGLDARAPLTIERTTVVGDSYAVIVEGAGGVVISDSALTGGNVGLRTASTTTVERSTMTGVGIGLLVQQTAGVTVADSSIALLGDGPGGSGVFASAGGDVTLRHATVVTDAADAFALNAGAGGTIRVGASIVAQRAGDPGCKINGGTIASTGHNVASDASCGLAGDGDLVADPQVAGFDAAAGVAAPELTSPAVDHVPAASCTSDADQIGTTRPQGAACDAGAVELFADRIPPPTASTTTTTTIPVGGPAAPATPVVAAARFTG